ncbi:MAG: formate dehydrogenase, partial [Flavobacteriales bacterium]|nr:formate dehydrogenase [Flavobacteriales bacterium]
MSNNLSELSGKKGLSKNLFEKLANASIAEGSPSKKDLAKLADEFLIGKANTYGTVSFYDFMKPENKGKKAYVCNGTACLCAGQQAAVQSALEKHYSNDEIGHMTCLGRCHENAAFHLDGINYSGADINNLANLKSQRSNQFNVGATTEILTTDYSGFNEYYSLLKTSLKKESSKLLDEIKKSNIRGRGGAGFPMGFKWEACRNEKNDTKFIICNADEGDPGAYSDGYLLEQRPHSVLFGMMVAGYITGAEWGVLYIRAEYPES